MPITEQVVGVGKEGRRTLIVTRNDLDRQHSLLEPPWRNTGGERQRYVTA